MLPRLQHLITVLPWQDWAALALFVFGWIGYAQFASRRARVERTLLSSTNHYRRLWMLQVTHRDQRIVDAAITQNLASSPSFWASTTILVIGGLLAVLGTTEKASEFVGRLFKNVKVLDSGARGATTTFTERGIGDVLLAWGNEAYHAAKGLDPQKFGIAAKHYYRPRDAKVAAKYANQFAKVNLITIDDVFGGWDKAQKAHFADGGSFDRIYEPGKK